MRFADVVLGRANAMTTKARQGILIWIAAVVSGSAAAILLKQLGVFYALAEASGFLVGGLIGWLWARQSAPASGHGRTRRFWIWSAWWVAGALVGAAIRVTPWQ